MSQINEHESDVEVAPTEVEDPQSETLAEEAEEEALEEALEELEEGGADLDDESAGDDADDDGC